MAGQEGHSAIVDMLLRHGADPNIARNVSQLYSLLLLYLLSYFLCAIIVVDVGY